MPEENIPVDKPTLQDYLDWDIYMWSNALFHWKNVLEEHNIKSGLALEIGSKNGGLSLYLANEFGFNVICSDIIEPREKAKQLHKKFAADNKIEYRIADALDLKFPDKMFEVIIFKSVLGSIGRNDNYKNQKIAVKEMYRVLKPGGILLFAENAKASFVHNVFRKIFRKWASYWRYITKDEMSDLLKDFSKKEIKTAGFISAFITNTKIKKIVLPIDNLLDKIIPEKSRCVIYGYAVK